MSSRNTDNWLIKVYQSPQTVFNLTDMSLITKEPHSAVLTKKLNYQVKKGNLLNPRKGIYAKPGYDIHSLAGKLYTPSYVSFENILQSEGIIFQYSDDITMASYLSRTIEIEGHILRYRKVRDEILYSGAGVLNNDNTHWRASRERAFLDLLYLNGDFYFDNLNSIDKNEILKLLPVYNSTVLKKRVEKIFDL